MTETDQPVREDVTALLAFLNDGGRPDISTLSPNEAREAYLAMKPLAEADPRELAVIRDLACPGPAGEIPLRLFDLRESRAPGPVIVFFHGGGFVIGDLDSHHNLCTELAAEMDLPVVAVHYRLAPEHPFPAAPDDCEAAARWIAGNPQALGRQATGLIPFGDSAGGCLTIVVTQALTAKPAEVPVLMQVPIYPGTDGHPDSPAMRAYAEGYVLTRKSIDWFMNSYAGHAGNPRAFPILGDHSGTPPTVLVTAGLDPIRDGGRAYGARLLEAGVDVTFLEMKGAVHGFLTMRKALPSAQADTLRIFAAMKQMLARLG